MSDTKSIMFVQGLIAGKLISPENGQAMARLAKRAVENGFRDMYDHARAIGDSEELQSVTTLLITLVAKEHVERDMAAIERTTREALEGELV